jgi:glycosyltransferase involved in cell wall biosynthesis
MNALSPSPDRAGTQRRRVLFIASRFPPVATIDAIRAWKFVKHLVPHGWDAVVVSAAMRKGPIHAKDARRAVDMESLADLPANLSIHRISAVMDHWPTRLTRSLAARFGRVTARLGWDTARWSGVLGYRLCRVHDALSFPDRGVWRLPSAVRLALSLHRKHRFDAMMTCGTPLSEHLIGLVVQALLRVPWVADLRDPSGEYAHWQQWESNWGRRVMEAAETAVFRRADRVIGINPIATDAWAKRYSAARRKLMAIPNGFDPADIPKPIPARSRGEFRLTCVGTLDATRTPTAVLSAFQRFLEVTPGSRTRARLEFAGRAGPFAAELAGVGREAPVEYLGRLPHAAALRRMSEADANIIILPNLPAAEHEGTATVCECLGAGRPILAAVPEKSLAAAVLRDFDGVRLCEPDDVEAITRAMGDLYGAWLADEPPPRRPAAQLASMTWQFRSAQLARCLNEAIRLRREGG